MDTMDMEVDMVDMVMDMETTITMGMDITIEFLTFKLGIIPSPSKPFSIFQFISHV